MRVLAVCLMLGGCGRIGFDALGGQGDGGGGTDGAGGDGGTTTDGRAPADVNVVFVTSTTHVPGELGGFPAADLTCAARGVEAGRPGRYRAWLSTATTPALARIAGARGWVRPDGRPVSDRPEDIVAGTIWYPLDLDEQGRAVRTSSGVLVATASDMLGAFTGDDCGGYASTTGQLVGGRADVGFRNWTQGLSVPCAQPARLYCFQVDHAAPVAPEPGGARRAFITVGTFAHNSGIAAADALCQGEATSAALTGTYRALLATDGAAPIARFDTTGPTWARVDGVQLAASAAAFAAGAFLAPLEVMADGGRVLPGVFATTGAATPSTPGTAATTCEGWTRGSSTATRALASANSVEVFSDLTSNCVSPGVLYCLED